MVAACSDPDTTTASPDTPDVADAVSEPDPGSEPDSVIEDDVVHIDVLEPADTAEVPSSPFGKVTGICHELAAEVAGQEAGIWLNTFVFDGDPFAAADLDPDAKLIFDQRNAGGSSKCSEVFSMELMDDCLNADLYKTETQISYLADGPITDYAIDVGEARLGVSVTRAYKGPILEYSVEEATALLTKKLGGVLESSANVAPEDAWKKQILHVWTLNPDWADLVVDAWSTLGPELVADTIVIVTLETGSDFVTTDSCDD